MNKLAKIRSNLTRLDSLPLGKAALIIILFLDIFIIVAIFNGLSEHTRQISSPDEYIPYTCREIVINSRWNPTERTDKLTQLVVSYSRSYYENGEITKDVHPICLPFIDILDQVKADKTLVNAFQDRNKLTEEAGALQRKIDNLKGAYDTSLLEKIAQQQGSQEKVESIKQDVQEKTNSLNIIESQILSLEQTINEDAKIKRFWGMLEDTREQDRQRLLEDLRSANFWYPVKRLGMQMTFLLPLFVVFYLWNAASVRKNHGIQILVSSHLLVVSFIPILCKIFETIYDIIPKTLLKQIIDLLISLKLIAIWHYLVIALGIAAALFLIFIFQKKFFSREKLIERRISRGECQQCGKHLPVATPACPFCGFVQFKPCKSCNQLTHVHGKYCRECGAAVKNEEFPR
jgi:hypothetical protein